MMVVRPYDEARDSASLFVLWKEALGAVWPLTAEQFRRTLAATGRLGGQYFVARDSDRLLGFVAVQVFRDAAVGSSLSAIPLLLVAPAVQRRGIGTALHDHALDALRARGAARATAGGGSPRFWPGIPADLPAALSFFAARGWDLAETSHDLVRDLRRPPTQPEPTAPTPPGIAIGTASDAEVAELLAFERREFPSGHGAYDALLIARRVGGPIIGALIMFGPGSHPDRDDVIWTGLLGANCGGIGAVGVTAMERRRGIGAALVGRGTTILRERGIGNCCVGWTWLLDFYGQFGYRPWRSYAMGKRTP